MSQLVSGTRRFGRAASELLTRRGSQALGVVQWLSRPALKLLRPVWLRTRVLRRRYPQVLLLPASVPALLLLYQFLPVLWSRLTFELDIEWTEGGGLLHASRILRGQPLYPKPNSGFMPFPYPPLHPALIALLSKVFGLSYTVGRSVSLGATAGTCFLLCREVTRAWAPMRWAWQWGVLALGLIALGYPTAGTFYDLIRTDSLTLFLCVAACVAVQRLEQVDTRRQFTLCVFLFVAAVLSKQLALFYIAWQLTFLFLVKPLRAIALGFCFVLVAGICVAILNWQSDGGLLHYTFFNLGKHSVDPNIARRGANILLDFAPYIWIMPGAAIALIWNGRMTRRALAWLGMFVVAIPAGLLPYAKLGGWVNNFIPIVILAGPALLCMLGAAVSNPKRSPFGGGRWAEAAIFAYSVGLYTFQRSFDPQPFEVSKARRADAEKLKTFVRGLGGRVICPYNPAIPLLTGSRIEQTHIMPWFDALWSGNSKVNTLDYVRRVKPDYVLLSGNENGEFLNALIDELVLDQVCTDCGSTETLYARVSVPTMAFKPVRKRKREHCVFDFERGGLSGWTLSGDAFRDTDARYGCGFLGVEGHRFLNSQRDGQDGPRGTALSPNFELKQDKLSVRVGGGDSPNLRAELVVDGKVAYSGSGLRANSLKEYVWDVSGLRGKTAQLRVVDEEAGTWGHILVDSVCLED